MNRLLHLGLALAWLLPGLAAAQASRATKLGLVHDGNIEFPQLSPDGKRIAYEVNYPADKRRELFLTSLDGGKVVPGTKLIPEDMASTSRYGVANRITHGFSWATKGTYAYAYGVSDNSGAQTIYVDNWSKRIESGESANKNPAWDPSEARFVFSSGRTGNGDLYLWDQGNELQLTFTEKDAELYPVWHPQGGKVAYVRQGPAGSHLYLIDVDSFAELPLVQFMGNESTRPTFSPDGSKVAFFSNKGTDAPTKFGLWVTDSRPGGTARNLAPKVVLPSKGGASWTPDGKGIVAVLDDPDGGDPICIFPVDGGAPRCLSTGTRNNRDPQLSVQSGTWRLLFTAQAFAGDKDSTWQELFLYDIPR